MKFGRSLGEDNAGGSSETEAQQSWARRLSPVVPPPLALLEMGLLLALVLLEYFVDGFPALTRINPHPYWIAVLLLSLQYGTVSGLMAASIAIIGTVLIGMPEPDIEERYFNYLVRVWTQPVLWLLVALLLGTFRARQIEQRDELQLQVENFRTRSATLLDHATNLRTRCSMLERRLATRETSDTGQLLAGLARLGEAEPGRWASALKATLTAGFPKSQISLYSVDGEKVRLVLTHGQTPDVQMPPDIEPGHPLIAAVAGAGRAVSVLEPSDDAALRGLGVAAVPVFADDGASSRSRVIGILKADMLAPGQIDGSTTRRLAVIAAHLAPALQHRLVSPVASQTSKSSEADPAAARAPRTDGVAMLEDAIPTVRRWRMLRWLPGGRQATADPFVQQKPDSNDG